MRREIPLLVGCLTLYFVLLIWVFESFYSGEGSQNSIIQNVDKRLQKVSSKLDELTRQVSGLGEEGHTLQNGEEGNASLGLVKGQALEQASSSDKIALLIISCNRPDITRALDKVMKYRPKGRFPIVVSQDCGDQTTAKVVEQYDHDVIHIRQPNLGPVENIPASHRHFEGYYKISRHYKWALTEVFDALMFDQAIILEDDLEISPDFFNYFEATLPLLRADPSLFCISAWNDNGKAQFISDPEALYRSDFFPGLGWMMTRKLWEELDEKWPGGFWDDWLREPVQRKGRACIRPEISRTYTFGKIGASNGQYFDTHLKYIVLNERAVDFKSKDLSYLLKENYDPKWRETVGKAKEVSVEELLSAPDNSGESYRVAYRDNKHFEQLSQRIGLMSDLRAGVPRGAYLGIVPFKLRGNECYLVPHGRWQDYTP